MKLILPHDYPEAPPKGAGPSMLPVADLEVTDCSENQAFLSQKFFIQTSASQLERYA